MLPRKPQNASLLVVLGLVTLLLVTAACSGGDDVDADSGDDGAAATAAAEGPGTITLSSSAITGQSGKILLVFAQGGGQQMARVCTPITSDDFTLSATVMTEMPAGDNPCGDETSGFTFDEGTYSLTAGVYVGGQQTPEVSTTFSVTVAGDTPAEIDGAALSQ